MSGVPRRRLAEGYDISRVINGGWQLAADHGSRAARGSEVVEDLLRLAEAGFTTFDCADIYLGVEDLYGALLERWRSRGGARPDLQFHTKYVPDRSALGAVDRLAVERAVDRSLGRLGVERLDLVQFHWWDFAIPGWIEAASALDGQRQAGKIRCLGVTNFDSTHLETLLAAGIAVTSHQVQYSLLDRRPAARMEALCRAHGIQLLCYGSLAGGFLSEHWAGRPAPVPGREANRSLTKYRLIVEETGGWEAFQRLLAVLLSIAERHRVSVANVAARWVLDRPGVAAVILGAASADHLAENLELFELRLADEDRAELAAVLEHCPSPPGEPYELERRPGGRHAAILRTELHGAS